MEYLSKERYDEIVAELKNLIEVEYPRIKDELSEARAQGDLSENAEYDAAKEDQSQNESRINEIRHILATARVAEDSNDLEVSIGCTVELEDAKGKKTSFTIVGTTETDSLAHKISNESPAGATLIGRATGDKVSFSTPSGKVREYTITSIRRQ